MFLRARAWRAQWRYPTHCEAAQLVGPALTLIGTPPEDLQMATGRLCGRKQGGPCALPAGWNRGSDPLHNLRTTRRPLCSCLGRERRRNVHKRLRAENITLAATAGSLGGASQRSNRARPALSGYQSNDSRASYSRASPAASDGDPPILTQLFMLIRVFFGRAAQVGHARDRITRRHQWHRWKVREWGATARLSG